MQYKIGYYRKVKRKTNETNHRGTNFEHQSPTTSKNVVFYCRCHKKQKLRKRTTEKTKNRNFFISSNYKVRILIYSILIFILFSRATSPIITHPQLSHSGMIFHLCVRIFVNPSKFFHSHLFFFPSFLWLLYEKFHSLISFVSCHCYLSD